MKPTVYEGTEPYIFVSYAHRDAERVFEVLSELQERGYRFWYDDGIAPGSEWPEDIARHLDASAMVVAFITPNSMKSQNCRREINFSLSREKQFLSVVLEKTKMPLGMEMQLSAQQSILRYNYDSWQAFIKKILACPGLAPCLAEPEPEPEPVVEAPAPTREPVQEPTPTLESAPEVAPVAATAVAPTPVTPAAPVPKAQEAPAEPSPTAAKGFGVKRLKKRTAVKPTAKRQEKTTKKMNVPVIAVVLGAVLLVAFIVGAVHAMNHFTTSWGHRIDKNSHYVVVPEGTKVEQSDLEEIASMVKLSSLDLSGCDLSACDLSALPFATTANVSLELDKATGIDDYSFLTHLNLDGLSVAGCENFDDAALALVDTSDLKSLDVSGTGVTDLSVLAGDGSGEEEYPLETLCFANTKVKDLSPLSQLQELQDVDGSNTKVKSIAPLAALTNLHTLSFNGCNLGATTDTFASLRLSELNVAQAQVSDLSGFSDCTTLWNLDLSGNPELTSLDWLNRQNCDTLSRLNLSQTGLDADDLSWIVKCESLEQLRINGLSLSDLSFVEGLTKLELLTAINCGLEDISALKSCTGLEDIYLSYNKLDSVEALSGLQVEAKARLINLDLTHNELTSVAELPAGTFRSIMLYGNADDVAGTLPRGTEANMITTSYFDGIEDTFLDDATSCLYMVGCPNDQVVKVESTFGGALELTTEDELWNLYATNGFAYELDEDASYVASVAGGEVEGTGEVEETETTELGAPEVTETIAFSL